MWYYKYCVIIIYDNQIYLPQSMQEKDNCIEIHDRADKIVTNQYPSKLKRLVELPDVRWEKDHSQVETNNQGTATATKGHQHNLKPLCKIKVNNKLKISHWLAKCSPTSMSIAILPPKSMWIDHYQTTLGTQYACAKNLAVSGNSVSIQHTDCTCTQIKRWWCQIRNMGLPCQYSAA